MPFVANNKRIQLLFKRVKKLPSWEPSKADLGVETSPVLAIVVTAPQGTVVAVPRAGLTGLSPLPWWHSRAPAPSDQHPQWWSNLLLLVMHGKYVCPYEGSLFLQWLFYYYFYFCDGQLDIPR